MNILFIGQVVPESEIKKCSAYSVAGDIMQKNIIKGLAAKEKVEVTVVSVLPIAAFPKDKCLITGKKSKYAGVEINNCSFINIPGIKQFSQMWALYRCVLSMVELHKYDLIICYNMYPQFGKVALRLEKKLNIPLVAILADLPVENPHIYKGLNRFLFIPLKHVTMSNIGQVKHGIILNQNVQKYMHSDSDCIVVSGGVDNDRIEPFTYKNVKNRTIVYAGALSEYSGVTNLIKAVLNLDIDNVCLEIYGDGVLKEDVISISKQSKRIRYMGVRPISEMRKIMEEAWVLVNPRSVDDSVSAVTFPSKIFEYLMCKRPVITTEFSGFPECIKDVTVGCGQGSPKEMVEAINRVLLFEEEELSQFIAKAYDFVVNDMSWERQTDRIFNYLEKISEKS